MTPVLVIIVWDISEHFKIKHLNRVEPWKQQQLVLHYSSLYGKHDEIKPRKYWKAGQNSQKAYQKTFSFQLFGGISFSFTASSYTTERGRGGRLSKQALVKGITSSWFDLNARRLRRGRVGLWSSCQDVGNACCADTAGNRKTTEGQAQRFSMQILFGIS